jgi:hypothetical protein
MLTFLLIAGLLIAATDATCDAMGVDPVVFDDSDESED